MVPQKVYVVVIWDGQWQLPEGHVAYDVSIDSEAGFLGSGLSSPPLSSYVIVGTLTAFFGPQLSHL